MLVWSRKRVFLFFVGVEVVLCTEYGQCILRSQLGVRSTDIESSPYNHQKCTLEYSITKYTLATVTARCQLP